MRHIWGHFTWYPHSQLHHLHGHLILALIHPWDALSIVTIMTFKAFPAHTKFFTRQGCSWKMCIIWYSRSRRKPLTTKTSSNIGCKLLSDCSSTDNWSLNVTYIAIISAVSTRYLHPSLSVKLWNFLSTYLYQFNVISEKGQTLHNQLVLY